MPLDRVARAAREVDARPLERFPQSNGIWYDESRRVRRRRRTHVGCEVTKRRVLLVADGGDDRHGGRRHCAHDPLIREREEILEAAAASREHDHVCTPFA